ncbi:MAG: efflux RND transporter periplasmic adaptor subunit [Lentisphaeria bacterium]|nr:efflux RND transporter periplasmic adaptor subunit [Lentisphaeria bacterium]
MKKTIKFILITLIIAGIAFAGYKIYHSYAGVEKITVFKTESITRADLMRSISATGTVEPEELVNVGAQVNGKIMSFGADAQGKTVDFGSKVTKGMVLALIDDIIYKAELQEAQAAKQQAEAAIITAKASIKDAQASELLAKNNWERAQLLYKEKSMTKSDYESNQAAYDSAIAQTEKSRASLNEAQAKLLTSEATLVKAQRNLEYCTITSPVDGIIIDRRVSVGQTVVSNQTASSIFLVASDFKRMQVWVSVNEADIGAITPGMPVQFFCDAFPGVEFRGEVFRIRLNATLSSNVVTYIVEVNADNAEGKLIPYLTANVKFIRAEHKDVMALPSSILRYTPPEELLTNPPARPAGENEAVLYVASSENKLRPVLVKTGLNTGSMVEIISSELKAGDAVVSGVEVLSSTPAETGGTATKNPFLPTPPKRSGKSGAATAR